MSALRIAARRLPTQANTLALAPRVASLQAVRFQSTSTTPASKEDPKSKAAALIDSLPGNNAITKTGWITLGTGAAAYAVSKELFVVNEEVVVAGCLVALLGYLSTLVRKPYAEWADGQIEKIRSILNGARAEHTSAVQQRIDSVKQLKDIESITGALFEMSKETAQLEHQAFVLRQRVTVASEIRSVLDSWVRYEAQQREAEQKELVRSVQAKVEQQLQDKKLQRDILVNAVQQVETLVKNKAI